MTTLYEIEQFLFSVAPKSLTEKWDNVGIQIGYPEKEIQGALIALDPLPETVQEAVEKKCDLLITHHPLFFEPIRKIDRSTLSMRTAQLAIEEKISILSFHTNLDSASEGLNQLMAEQIGIHPIKPLIKSNDLNFPKTGMGRIGNYPTTPLQDFLFHLLKVFGIKNLRHTGEASTVIQKVAVVSGSGSEFYRESKEQKADVLVTSDLKYHTALEAKSSGITIVDIGHYASEKGMISLMAKKLHQWKEENRKDFFIEESTQGNDPFQFFQVGKT